MTAPHRTPHALVLAALALVALAATAALAHKVNVFAVAENGVITGEGYFSGGAKAQNVPVELRDASGSVVATTVTTTDGAFSIPLPKGAGAPLTIVLKAGDGHQNDYILTAQDLAAGSAGLSAGGQTAAEPGKAGGQAKDQDARPVPSQAPSPDAHSPSGGAAGEGRPAAAGSADVPAGPTGQAGQAGQALSGMDHDALAALVEAATAKAVEQKIAPLRMELAKLAGEGQSRRLQDIVGGLGWIVGLVGVAAWFKRPKG